ncbi:MAG TPA: hypothetical protein VGR96_11370 [Acidobacteriaceae bacterium]|nr:hypothetical protein [Acidobacteriaceae bacterium]
MKRRHVVILLMLLCLTVPAAYAGPTDPLPPLRDLWSWITSILRLLL